MSLRTVNRDRSDVKSTFGGTIQLSGIKLALVLCFLISFYVLANPVEAQARVVNSNVAAGKNHTLAINKDGELWAWGCNLWGQLGDGTRTDRRRPVRIGGEANWVDVCASGNSSWAINSRGEIWAWGDNEHSQLGDGTRVDRNRPFRIGSANNWVMMSASDFHRLALNSKGEIFGWGASVDGQLGNGVSSFQAVPMQIKSEIVWSYISSGTRSSHGICVDGALYSWGTNELGTLGFGNVNTLVRVPTQVGVASNWTDIHSGGRISAAINEEGELFFWGRDQIGAMGVTGGGSFYPTKIGSDLIWSNVSTGEGRIFAITNQGYLFGWGLNGYGNLGLGWDIRHKVEPVQIGKASDWSAVSVGERHSVASNESGRLFSWGSKNHLGQIGDGSSVPRSTPLQVMAITDSRDARSHVVTFNSMGGAQVSSQTVLAGDTIKLPSKPEKEGYEFSGWFTRPIGGVKASEVMVPIKSFTLYARWHNRHHQVQKDSARRISAGPTHSLAICDSGNLFSWGSNGSGQLGNGTKSPKSKPVQIGEGIEWAEVSAGRMHSLAIDTQGRLFAWGSNVNGALGVYDCDTPTLVDDSRHWVSVSAGAYHSLALDSHGRLYSWGLGRSGQLGHNDYEDRYVITRIGNRDQWRAISACENHSLAICSDGFAYSWGDNSGGQLGIGANSNRSVPTRVESSVRFSAISAGGSHSLAICELGYLFAWGRNNWGQLGDGSLIGRSVPAQIGLQSNWVHVSAGSGSNESEPKYHSLAINDRGEIFQWGTLYETALYGQAQINSIPVQVGHDGDWQAVSAGSTFSLSLDVFGDFYSWGKNAGGTIANGGNLGSGPDAYSLQPLRAIRPTDPDASEAINIQFCAGSVGPRTHAPTRQIELGNSIGSLPELKLDTWTFLGWTTEYYGGEQISADTVPTECVTYYSRWGSDMETHFWIGFSGVDSSGAALQGRYVLEGEPLGELPIPIPVPFENNRVFSGWYTKYPSGGVRVSSDTTARNGINILYPRWESGPPNDIPSNQNILPASITINHPNAGALMLVGQTRQLSANVLPANAANRNVVWTSSNPAVATVAANGQLRAVRPGTATITARTAAGNRVATTTVRIQASPAALNSSQRNIRMRQGTTFRIPLIVRGTTNTDVTVNWRTTNRNVATLVAGLTNGTMNIRQNASRVLTIRAVRPGTARIVLTAQNGRTITYNITVQRNNQRLNRVRISNLPPRNTMNRNVTRNLSYRVTPVRATKTGQVRWTSSRPRVATIDQAGRLQSRERGQTIITLRVGTQVHRVTVTVR